MAKKKPTKKTEITSPVIMGNVMEAPKVEVPKAELEGELLSITDMFLGNTPMKQVLFLLPDQEFELNTKYKLIKID